MKHSSIRELFEYWNAQRGWRAAPERHEIEPGAIRHLLADTFILSLDAHARHPFRVAGTRVCALFGRELKGLAFLELWSAESRGFVEDLVGIIADETIGVVASVEGITARKDDSGLELLILPLVHRGRSDTRVLGALVRNAAGGWQGDEPLAALRLGIFRYVGPVLNLQMKPRAALPLPGGRIRRGLVVYDGGQP